MKGFGVNLCVVSKHVICPSPKESAFHHGVFIPLHVVHYVAGQVTGKLNYKVKRTIYVASLLFPSTTQSAKLLKRYFPVGIKYSAATFRMVTLSSEIVQPFLLSFALNLSSTQTFGSKSNLRASGFTVTMYIFISCVTAVC